MAQFKPRIRKHKARERAATGNKGANNRSLSGSHADSNATELLPPSAVERQAKKDALKESLRPELPMSSKKKKRLDKYIDNKLRKEENLELLKKLAAHKVDTSIYRSTTTIGQHTGGRHHVRTADSASSAGDSDLRLSESEADDLSTSEAVKPRMRPPVYLVPVSTTPIVQSPNTRAAEPRQRSSAPVTTGFGLKRPLDQDSEGRPVIKKRQRTNTRSLASTAPSKQDELPWEGFSDSEVSEDPAASETSDSELGSENPSESDESGSGDGSGSESGSGDESELSDGDIAAIFSTVSNAKQERDAQIKEAQDQRRADFKAWATQQINEARDFAPTAPISHIEALSQIAKPKDFTPRPAENDPLPRELETKSNGPNRKAYSVQVQRPADIEEARLKLPVVAEEQKIMEAIHNNPVVIICGATGSGKTTQIPQFLYEAGYGASGGPTPGIIAVTQPRRVAAVTMAKRVGEELGGNTSKVGHQIRFDSTVGKDTALKFMTDGILLREISQDFTLSKYSAVIIDEAHERSVNTDILIGMVSRIVGLRENLHRENPEVKPLKMIIMSATLMVNAFTENTHLFRTGPPPLIQSEGRQYPVTMHFARRTQRDYVDETYRKVVRGHKKLPPGSMLVFLTGQNEISELAKQLREALPTHQSSSPASQVRIAAKDAPLEADDIDIGDDRLADDYDSEDGLSSDQEADEDKEFDIAEEDEESPSSKIMILPLYSQLSTKEQMRVFEPPPEHTRLIILATNVAETSITIPGIRYVFDCGRAKEKAYDKLTGVQNFEINWISKASAAQRAGRAGRTGPGHCYRLYSSAVYERDFEEHTAPEILKAPAEGVVLQLKTMQLPHVLNFPFPTPPDRDEIARAENLLAYLGALDGDGKITSMGRELSVYPVSPRYAKILTVGHQHACIYLAVATVAALAISDIFISENQLDMNSTVPSTDEVYGNTERLADDAREARRKEYTKAHYTLSRQDPTSDAIKLLSAFCAYASDASQQHPHSGPTSFCTRWFMRPKALAEALQLYQQLLYIVGQHRPGTVDPSKTNLVPPTKTQLAALKQIIAVGFIDQVAIRADLSSESLPPGTRKPRRATEVPYLTLFPSYTGIGSPQTLEDAAVFVHPSSVLAHAAPKDMPPYLIYARLQRAAASSVGGQTPRTRMHPLTPITAAQIFGLAKGTPLVEYGKPIGKVVERGAGKREAWVVPSLVGVRGRREWPLPAVKVLQVRDVGRGWWKVDSVTK